MEALYAKLYDKYTKLKKNKFAEIDEVNKEQEAKFLKFVSATEELVQHMSSENKDLQGMVDNLRNENTLIRSTRDEERLEYQKRLVEEERKVKALSGEVGKLKELIQEGVPHNYKDQSGRNQERKTPESAQVTTRSMTKRSRQPEDVVEMDMVSSPHISKRHKSTETLLVSQPQCCKTTYDGSSNSASCTFQALCEHLLGMKLSANNEGEQACITALHPSSGLSFSLTMVNNSAGEEPELLYKVVSLGTLERVAPKWMRDVIMFSTRMCPIFFERVSRVIKVQH